MPQNFLIQAFSSKSATKAFIFRPLMMGALMSTMMMGCNVEKESTLSESGETSNSIVDQQATIVNTNAVNDAKNSAPPATYYKNLWLGQKRPATAIEDSIYGMHTTLLSPSIDRSRSAELLDMVEDSGYRWVKDTLWCYLSAEQTAADVASQCTGSFDSFEHDYFSGLKSRHLKPLIRLDLKHAGKYPKTQVAIDAYKEFVRLAVERFSPYVQHWEILNEPNILNSACYKTPKQSSCAPALYSYEYVKVVSEAQQVIKEIDPSAKVHAGAFAMLQAMYTWHVVVTWWFDGFFTMDGSKPVHHPYDLLANLTPHIDYLSSHPYRLTAIDSNIPENASQFSRKIADGTYLKREAYLNQIKDLQERLINVSGKNIPVSVTETGYCSLPDRSAESAKDCLTSNITQAKYEQRSAILDFVAKISPRINYVMRVWTGSSFKERSYEFVENNNGNLEPKPIYYAVRPINWMLDNELEKSQHTCTVETTAETQAHMLERKSTTFENVCLYWEKIKADDNFQAKTVNVRISSAQFTTPILVDLFTTSDKEPTRTRPKYHRDGNTLVVEDVPLKDSPMALIFVPDYMANISEFDYLLFNEEYYLRHRPDVANTLINSGKGNALEHFIKWGKAEGANPTPLFDEDYYLQTYTSTADAVASGVFKNGYEHFAQYGIDENRDPNAYFDSAAYLSARPDIKNMSAFRHYVLYGANEGIDPGPNFDESWYLKTYPDVAVAVKAKRFRSGFYHFMAVGKEEGRQPKGD